MTKLMEKRGHRIFFDNLNDDSIIVDAGVCRGDFIRFLRSVKETKKCKIFGIEGCKRNYEAIKNQKFGNTKLINKALVGQDSPDELTFYDYSEYNGRGSIGRKHTDDRYPSFKKVGVDRVYAIKINDIFYEFDIDKIDYFKIDIESAEHDVFSTMTEETASKIEQISMEVHVIPGDERNIVDMVKALYKDIDRLGFTSTDWHESEKELWVGR